MKINRKLLDDKSTKVFNDDQSLGGYGMGAQIKFPGENNLNKGSYQDFGDIWLDFSKMGLQDQNVKKLSERAGSSNWGCINRVFL